MSQACGLDLFLTKAPIIPLARPVFDLDCTPGTYFSYVVGDNSAPIAAVNAISSRSGCSALYSHCKPKTLLVTGSHEASLAALRNGEAGVAAIDAVTWHILKRETPAQLSGLPICARSTEAPSPPYVTRNRRDPQHIFSQLQGSIGSPQNEAARAALLLRDIMPTELKDYAAVFSEFQEIVRYPSPEIIQRQTQSFVG